MFDGIAKKIRGVGFLLYLQIILAHTTSPLPRNHLDRLPIANQGDQSGTHMRKQPRSTTSGRKSGD